MESLAILKVVALLSTHYIIDIESSSKDFRISQTNSVIILSVEELYLKWSDNAAHMYFGQFA